MAESKWFKKSNGCNKECVGEITALTKMSKWFQTGNVFGAVTIATHPGGFLSVSVPRGAR
jgi:hypothetical protein